MSRRNYHCYSLPVVATTNVFHNCFYYKSPCILTGYSYLEVYFSGDKFENNEMDGACGAYGGDERRTQSFGGETTWENEA